MTPVPGSSLPLLTRFPVPSEGTTGPVSGVRAAEFNLVLQPLRMDRSHISCCPAEGLTAAALQGRMVVGVPRDDII